MFKVLKVSASKSRTGGANINCQEIVKHAVFGNCNGKEFIIQTDTMPNEAIVGTEIDANVIFEDVDYTFMRDGKQVNAKYTRGIPC